MNFEAFLLYAGGALECTTKEASRGKAVEKSSNEVRMFSIHPMI